MKKLTILLLFLLIMSCQNSLDVNEPDSTTKNSVNTFSKFQLSNDLTLNEDGFNEYLLAENLVNPEGIIFHPQSNGILVTQSTVGNIMEITRKGESSEFSSIPDVYPPEVALIDLLFDPTRGVFVTSLRHGNIYLIDKSNNLTNFASELFYPLFMEIDREHNLYVSELYGNCITRIDPLQNKTNIIEGVWRPRGIVFDNKEKLYVLTNWDTKEIRMFDIKNSSDFPINFSDGELITTLSGSDNPQDIVLGFNGDLFVVDNTTIWRITLDGNVSKFAEGLSGPHNTINSTSRKDLMVTDYGTGKVYGISKKNFVIN